MFSGSISRVDFCLGGGNEHRELSKFNAPRMDTGIQKTHRKIDLVVSLKCTSTTSVFEIYRNSESVDRCHCRILDLYISKLPAEARDKDLFYVRPMEKVNKSASTHERSAWYYSIPVGRNKLAQMAPEMCKLANISGNKTNHSLRTTGATELYEAEVPEKIIQERTGHRSLECLRMYERTSDKQQQAVSNILSSDSRSSYHAQISKLNPNNHQLSTQTTSTSSISDQLHNNMSFANCQVTSGTS